jgi:hypothetical protein
MSEIDRRKARARLGAWSSLLAQVKVSMMACFGLNLLLILKPMIRYDRGPWT